MGNRLARGLVMVPAVVLGGVFMATGFYSQAANFNGRVLAIGLGLLLLGAGLVVGLLPPRPGT